jgi:quercetin dioxygenase-like cupin family protein
LMCDPLLSRKVDSDCIAVKFPHADNEPVCSSTVCETGSFRTVGEPGIKPYGPKAYYSIPEIKIRGTDASFVHLTLKPGGYSESHHHAGDELMFVLKGGIQLHFPDGGTSMNLPRWSYAHFYAEQTHSARNLSTTEDAELFIIRFYQQTREEIAPPEGAASTLYPSRVALLPHRVSRRQEMRKELRKLSTDIRPQLVDPFTRAWIVETVAGRSIPATGDYIPEEVMNNLGLARFLRLQPKDERGLPGSWGANWLTQLAIGERRIQKHEIKELHSYYELFDLLLWSFLFPGVLHQIVVSRQPAENAAPDWVNMERVFGALHDQLPKGIQYEVPRRSLACSDLSVCWLKLEARTSTDLNQHMGCELLLPLSGQVAVEYGDCGEICRLSELSGVAHYVSSRKHLIHNPGDKAAEMLLIRFFTEERVGRTDQ